MDITVTNKITCDTKLTLAKVVANGPANPANWNLTAYTPAGAPAGTKTGPVGATGSAAATASVTPGIQYELAEGGPNADPRYKQVDNRSIPLQAPQSTGSWTCIPLNADGSEQGGSSGGLNGWVNVPLGTWVKCSAVNETASLTVIKEVKNGTVGTAVPSNWTLTSTPTGTVPAGLTANSDPGSATGVSHFVRPGQGYKITESTGPAKYTLNSIACNTGPEGEMVSVPTGNISVPAQGNVTCVVTNVFTGLKIEKQAWNVSTPWQGSYPPANTELPAGSPVPSGNTITWTYTVTNTGGGTVNGITVVDNKLPAASVTCPKTSLASGEVMICTASGALNLGIPPVTPP
nr:hypothetical protein [Lysinibacter cavernae]